MFVELSKLHIEVEDKKAKETKDQKDADEASREGPVSSEPACKTTQPAKSSMTKAKSGALGGGSTGAATYTRPQHLTGSLSRGDTGATDTRPETVQMGQLELNAGVGARGAGPDVFTSGPAVMCTSTLR